jgi:ribose 5-phosphate isomerase B
MKIAIGSDHAGFHYKEKIKERLIMQGHQCRDFGTSSDKAVDYPLFVRPVAEAVARGEFDRGIVLGGSGNGQAIVANKFRGIRCALCWNKETARLSRKHNDANVLSLGARMIPEKDALEILDIWLITDFEGGRHIQRIKQIDEIEAAVLAKSTSSTAIRRDLEGTSPKPSTQDPSKAYDVLIAFRYVKYFEGENDLELQIDPGLKKPSVIHVPSPERWRSQMPAWARDRRELILERLKSKCSHMQLDWKEY